MKELPDDLSRLDAAELDRAALARDEHISPLFDRWPSLTRAELRDLDRLWAERVRVAKHLGVRRRRPLRRASG